MSIVNGLFAGRSGIASHGAAIAVVGDNISNSSTVGYKASRAEFEDLIAGAGGAGRTIGSGSSVAAVTTPFTQGTLEFTSRSLDLAIDGNGVFAVADGEQRFYTRAGNFQINAAGNIVDQNGYSVLGYPANGTGALESINVNSVSSSSVTTSQVSIAGNLDASATERDIASLFGAGGSMLTTAAGADHTAPDQTTTYSDLASVADHQTIVNVVDSLGESHQVTVFYYRDDTAANQWEVRAYVNSEEVDDPANGAIETGEPRLLGSTNLVFPTSGSLSSAATISATDIQWNSGSDQTQDIDISFFPLTQFAAPSDNTSITQDGQGVGAVTTLSIDTDGTIFANLDNGETATIGTIGLVNFANPEGLQRVGNNLLVQSNASGEPIAGLPGAGTFGDVQSGSLELSTTDIATEFVKLITLQRGFQASSRIITTINQLLNEVIQLA